jgi:hypothetical protein
MNLKQIDHPRIELMTTSSLKPNPSNARTHSDKQIAQIAASIQQFGFLVPIVVDDSSLIAAGHGRWQAAKRLGLREVPVVRARFVSDTDRRAFALAENRIAQLSGWDEDLLGEELAFLLEGGNLEITGFTTADLDLSLPEPTIGKPQQVELPDPAAVAVSRQGDLWLIGAHRLYCGDASDPASWEALLGEERAAMVFGDLPYNVPIDVEPGILHQPLDLALVIALAGPAEAVLEQVMADQLG